METIKFGLRLCVAFIAIVVILSIAQRWDDADTQRIRTSMSRGA